LEEVVLAGYESLKILALLEVQPAGQTGEDHAETEHIGEGIVVADGMFPGTITLEIRRPNDLVSRAGDAQVCHVEGPFANMVHLTTFSDNVEGGEGTLLDAPQKTRRAWFLALHLFEPQRPKSRLEFGMEDLDSEGAEALKGSDLVSFVDFGDLLQEGTSNGHKVF
jgi:hypothetical protein